VTLGRGPVRAARDPHVQVFVSSRFEIEGVVARVKVGDFVQEV
jgi:hypothetical protein